MTTELELTGDGPDRLAQCREALEATEGALRWSQHVVELADTDTGEVAFRPAADIDLVVGADTAATIWIVCDEADRWELDHVDQATDGYGGMLPPAIEVPADLGDGLPSRYWIKRRDPTTLYVRYDRTLHWRGEDPYAADTVRVLTGREELPDVGQHATLTGGTGPYRTDPAISPQLVGRLLADWCDQVAGMPVGDVAYVTDGPAPGWLQRINDRVGGPSTLICSECLGRLMGFDAAVGHVVRDGERVPVCAFHVRPDEQVEPLDG